MRVRRKTLIATAAAALLAGSSSIAHAQAAAAPAASEADSKTGLQTVTVTAERRSANLQKTAISMEVVGGNDIAEQGLATGADILKNVSNLEVQGAARGNILAIRGIGSDMPPGMGESSVSTNYDGVYNFRAEEAALGFFDLDRVEVLRGPQGTLYGRNATAGAVNYITRNPLLGKGGGSFAFEIGNYGLLRTEAGVNLPVSDTLALRASAAAINRNGFLTDGFDDAKAQGARLKALFKPNADLGLLVGLEKIHEGGKGVGMIPDANWDNSATRLTAETNPTDPGSELVGYQKYDASKLWAQLDANLGVGTLTVIPAYQKATGEVYRKWDASHRGAENWSYDPNPATQKSLEARLASNAGSAVQWVGGVYVYDMRNVLDCFLNCQTSETVDTTNSKALFGQASYALRPETRIVGGLRHTSDKKTNLNRPDGETWSSNDWKLSLEQDLGASALGYATLATAYRPGGFNTFNTANPRFDAEHLRSFELGLKSRLLDNTLQLNAAAFQMNYKNYQAIDNYLNPAVTDPTDPNFFLSNVMNVPHQTIRGLEADAQALLPGGGRLHASFTYLDAKLGDLVLHDFATAAAFSMQGQPLPHAPKTSIKLGAEQPVEVGAGAITLRADLRHVAQQYVSISESAATLQPSYTQLDLSAQYRPDSDKWGVNFYVKNATNYVPKTAEFFGYMTVGAPRTWGVVLTSNF